MGVLGEPRAPPASLGWLCCLWGLWGPCSVPGTALPLPSLAAAPCPPQHRLLGESSEARMGSWGGDWWEEPVWVCFVSRTVGQPGGDEDVGLGL